MKSFGLFLAATALVACAHAQSGLIRGDNQQPLSLEQAISTVQPGSIVVVGENHGFKTHQDQQLQIMRALRQRGLKVAVGMEFLYYPNQHQVDAFRKGELAEADFLKSIQWGSPSFDFYRDQALFPMESEGAHTIALNAPSVLTRQISKGGVASLDATSLALLPPHFTLGNDLYRERFLAAMGAHLPSPEAANNYFAAQSVWDDTMAWKAVSYLENNLDQVMVIVVGEFHTQYGGGLPARLRARGSFPVWTFSQVNTEGLTDQEVEKETQVSNSYGARADFIWIAPAL